MRRLSLIIACLLISSASANALDGFDNGSNAGVINRQNQMQLQQLQVEKKVIETTTDKPDGNAIKEDDDTKKKDVVKGNLTYNPKFKLNNIVFEGNTKVSEKRLLKLAKGLIGQDVYLEDVMNFTVDVSRYYQKQGYLTSYAYLAPQEIKDGVVVINVKESKVALKEVYGNKWERDWYVKNVLLGGVGLNENNVFNVKALQGSMKNIGKESYLRGTAEITKNKDDDTVVKLNVADRFPIKLSLGWDDFGRNYTGRQRFTGIAGLDNVTGFGDKLYVGTVLSQDSTGALAGYQIPIGKYGTKLGFDYSYSSVNIGGPYRQYGIKGHATEYAVRLIQPLVNTATKDISASVSLSAVNANNNYASASSANSNYDLRVLRSAIYGMFDDRHGRTISSVGVDIGTNALGASDNIDNGRQSVFYKVIASLARIQRLPKNCLGIFRINGQYSPQSLFASEQMYLGGVYSVRGYQPSELLGDYGVNGSLELRTPVPGLRKILPEKVKYVADRVKLATFFDWGYVKENDSAYNYGYYQNFLASVGFGTVINVTDAIFVQMGVGIPIGAKHIANEDTARFYFSVNSDIDRIFLKPKERL